MAKAIYGHVGMVSDYRLVNENVRLQRRVRELETQLKALEDLLQTTTVVESEILLEEPAYS